MTTPSNQKRALLPTTILAMAGETAEALAMVGP